jgi:hypothetical protein
LFYHLIRKLRAIAFNHYERAVLGAAKQLLHSVQRYLYSCEHRWFVYANNRELVSENRDPAADSNRFSIDVFPAVRVVMVDDGFVFRAWYPPIPEPSALGNREVRRFSEARVV